MQSQMHGSCMAVASNLCVGRQGRRAPEALYTRGVCGHAPPEIFEIQKPWNAISGSHFKFLPDPVDDFYTTPYLKLPKRSNTYFGF